jgi:hypothetical protein
MSNSFIFECKKQNNIILIELTGIEGYPDY